MLHFGRYGSVVEWFPSSTPEKLSRLLDPGKPQTVPKNTISISKNTSHEEVLSLKESVGWVRTWSELNRAVIVAPSPKLPKWHVLEGSLPEDCLPDDTAWENTNAGLPIWRKWSIIPGDKSPDYQWIKLLRHWAAKRQPHKNGWDRAFYYATPEPPREVCAIASLAKDQAILAFDTNGAYSYAVAHIPVPDASKLHLVTGETAASAWRDDRTSGVFRVKVTCNSDTPSWWREHHPLVHRIGKKVLPVVWPDEPVLTFLHSCERMAWEKVVNIEVIDGVVSQAIPHALSGTAKTLWEQRMQAATSIDKACTKWLLARLHTATVPARGKNVSAEDSEKWWKTLGCEAWSTSTEIPDIDNIACQWSSPATVSAWARANWVNFMTKVMELCPEAKLAYTNVDSMHFIVPIQKVRTLKEALESSNSIGAGWGKWRLQADAKYGVWLGLGKYWLVDDRHNLVLHQNMGNRNPWATGRRWYRPLISNDATSVTVTKISQTIWQSMSDHSSINHLQKGIWIYTRPDYSLVHDEQRYHSHLVMQLLYSRNRKKRFWYLTKKFVLK